MTKVLLVDDHILVRIGTIEAIESDRNMKVVADLSSGEEVLAGYEEHAPDVVIMDYRMPGIDGAEATRRLVEKHPEARVLIHSVYDGEEDVGRAVDAGARGYLLKGAETADLMEAIATIAAGENYFPASIAQKLKKREGRSPLTEREEQVLKLLVRGMSNKEIGIELSVSLATVKLHISNVLVKLDVADRTQAVVAAVRRGLVHLDE